MTDGHFTCDELKKSIFGCSCSGCKKCPEAVFFLLAILAASWGLVVHHITISEFSSILQGWKDGCQQYHSNTQVFFFVTYMIKGFLELNPVWLVKCRYDEKAGWGYPDATNSSRIFKRKVYKKSFKVLPSCSMFDQQRPGVSTRFEVCVCVCCNWGVLLRLVF